VKGFLKPGGNKPLNTLCGCCWWASLVEKQEKRASGKEEQKLRQLKGSGRCNLSDSEEKATAGEEGGRPIKGENKIGGIQKRTYRAVDFEIDPGLNGGATGRSKGKAEGKEQGGKAATLDAGEGKPANLIS